MHNKFTHALSRRPASSMAQGLTTRQLGQPNVELAQAQYEAYVAALRAAGLDVTVLDANPAFPDGHYVEDTAVIFRDVVFITQPGAEARRHESQTIAPALPSDNQVVMSGEAYLEGGDVLFCGDERVLIGLSTRTNLVGAEQLRAAIHNSYLDVKVDFVPVEGVLHLKTGLTELAPGVLLRSPYLKTDFDFSSFAQVITLPEAEEYASNVLPINDAILIANGYPTVHELASQHYNDVRIIDMSEFEKMDGSLTCLSLRYRQ